MSRVIVYVDGFNLYHSIDELDIPQLKWLDLWKLSENIIRDDQTLEGVKYFSAFATWRPSSHRKHISYVKALEVQGVEIIMGRFKEKWVTCRARCGEQYKTHEEKETDVNIGVHLVADALANRFDTAFVISADTDLNAAVAKARTEAPKKKISTVAPPGRFNRNHNPKPLFGLTKGKLRASLLPEIITASSGRTINRPADYS